MILSYRHQGKDVFTECVVLGNEVLFLDRSEEHGGWSITNSVEGAIKAFVERLGEGWVFYEGYDYDLERSFTRVELRNGVPYWTQPTGEEYMRFTEAL